MTNILQQIFYALNKNFYKSRQQRREAIERTYPFLDQIDKLMLVAVFTVPILLPLLSDLTILFNIPAWLWWMKNLAWGISLGWFIVRLSVTLFHAPSQLASATVDAMEQTITPIDPAFSSLTEPVEVECIPYSKPQETARTKSRSPILLATTVASSRP